MHVNESFVEMQSTTLQDLSSESVESTIDALAVGRSLVHPLHDARGVLLVSEGTAITVELKDLLRQRGIYGIRLHQEDADKLTLSEESVQNVVSRFGTEISEQLDNIIEKGMLFVQNDGKAVRHDLCFHGKKAYDTEHRNNLISQHAATSESLDSMMRAAVNEGGGGGSQVAHLAATYLTDMTHDGDLVISVASEVNRQGLSDHALRMSLLAMAMAIELGFDANNVRTIGVTGLVCDWGMTQIPLSVRSLDRLLTAPERVEIQKHPVHTLDLLERMSGFPSLVPLAAYQVHERLNGTGYPRRRTGKSSIHPFARVLAVADIYTALTASRPFRKALMPYAAIECVLSEAKHGGLDVDVVRALLRVLSLFPIGSFVQLTDQSIARVIRRNGSDFAHPIVQLVRDADGNRVDADKAEPFAIGERDLVVQQALPTPGREEMALNDEIRQFHLPATV